MEQVLLEAEKFKTQLTAPKGNVPAVNGVNDGMDWQNVVGNVLRDNDDDDFFHVTCHIDSVMREKIEHGEMLILNDSCQRKGMLINLGKKTEWKLFQEMAWLILHQHRTKAAESMACITGSKLSESMLLSTHKQTPVMQQKFGNMCMS